MSHLSAAALTAESLLASVLHGRIVGPLHPRHRAAHDTLLRAYDLLAEVRTALGNGCVMQAVAGLEDLAHHIRVAQDCLSVVQES